MVKKMTNDDKNSTKLNIKVDVEEIKNRLEKYMEAKIPVHVVFKIKKGQQKVTEKGDLMPRFLNGYITGKKSNDIYVIDERKLGQTYILIDEVFSVTVYAKNNEALAEEVQERAGFIKGEGFSNGEIDLVKDLPDYTPKEKKEPKTNWS